MNHTLTWHFGSTDQARNVKDDLRAMGLPMENMYIDAATQSIKIITPQSAKPAVVEILERHGLTELPLRVPKPAAVA